MARSTLYLIPIPIAEGKNETLSETVKATLPNIRHYFVENIRTARRFIKSVYKEANIDALQFSLIDKHNGADMTLLKKWISEGITIGVMSESGCPGIADPGADLVAVAQSLNVKIVPLVGPSSIFLALMASGLNGQQFCFHGYLPVKEPARTNQIKSLEHNSQQFHQTQIFIETPYRNHTLLSDLLKTCKASTRLCIAYNITADDALIQTKSIKEWKDVKPELEKQPCIFLLLA